MAALPVAGFCPTVPGAAVSAAQNPRVTQADERAAQRVRQRFLTEGISENEILGQELARHREAAEAEVKAREDALREALTVAANRLDLWHVSAIASGNEALRCKLANWCEEARAAITKEPDA